MPNGIIIDLSEYLLPPTKNSYDNYSLSIYPAFLFFMMPI